MKAAADPGGPAHRASYLGHNIPGRLAAGGRYCVRVLVRNTGTSAWRRDPPDGHFAGLAAFLDGRHLDTGRTLRQEVAPGEEAVFPLIFQVPDEPGRWRLTLDMVVHNVTMFSDAGTPPLVLELETAPVPKPSSKDLSDTALQRNYWHFTPSLYVSRGLRGDLYPLLAREAEGCVVVDVEGRTYLDYVMGWGCALLGYAHPRIQDALRRSLTSGGIMTMTHPIEIEVSEALVRMFPGSGMAIFGKNGSDVCTLAMRMARIWTGRPLVLVCGYHGWQDGYAEQYGFALSGIPDRPEPIVLPFPFLDLGALERLLATHRGRVAAVMLEPGGPVEGPWGPLRPADGGYLRELERMARREEALLIFDEIITGFRSPCGSVQRATGIRADLTCLGKALSGGMPLAALVGRSDIFRSTLPRVAYSPTFKGEAYSLFAAAEALAIYSEIDVPAHVARHGDRIREEANALFRGIGLGARVEGPPYRQAVFFSERDPERNLWLRTLWVQEMIRNGVIVFKGFMLPSLAHDERAADDLLRAMGKAARTVKDSAEAGRLWQSLEIPDVHW